VRLAGVLTQLACAGCLLLGTIAFVLVQQNHSGGAALAIVWALAAMVALVLGGLMSRGGLIAVIGSAALDLGLGSTLVAFDYGDLRSLLRVLPTSDVDTIADIVTAFGGGMIAIGVVCLIAIPQAIRYGRWLRTEPSNTMPGYPVVGSLWHMPAAPDERRSRRRMYFALAGFAIGFGAGVGVLVSSTAGRGLPAAKPGVLVAKPVADAGVVVATPTTDAAPVEPAPPGQPALPDVETFLAAERTALANADAKALEGMLVPNAFGFGIDADGVADGRAAMLEQLKRDLGAEPVTIEAKALHVGQEKNHAWIAEELEIESPGRGTRRVAFTQLAAGTGGKWQVVAWSWGQLVPDSVAERITVLGTAPRTTAVPAGVDGPKELDAMLRAAFGSRAAYIDARSERDDAFNVGSAPGERVAGGERIKQVFTRFRAEFRIHDNVHGTAGAAWDPAQKSAPWIAFAAVDVDLTFKTRAQTDLTQTFRVLAVAVREGTTWRLVQTQWSHGGPIR
jgi:SnoaL-like protein